MIIKGSLQKCSLVILNEGVKSSFIDKVLARLDNLSSRQVEVVVDRLAREKGLLEQVLESLQEGVILFDSDGITMFINQAAESMFGLGEQSCIGKSLAELLPGLDWSKFSPDEASVVSQDLEVLYPEKRTLNIYSAPIRDAISAEEVMEVSGRVLLIRDITVLREETEQSIESERFNALTLLAAGVAHEIGNPLNSLGIQLQLLKRKLNAVQGEEGDKMKSHLESAQAEIERLDSILKDFLHAIRPRKPKRAANDLNAILTKTVNGMEGELAGRKTQIRLNLSTNVAELSLDEGQIRQALYNVIRNASQSMSAEGGEISILTKVTEFEVSLHVKDQGGGISPEEMGRIYEPFQSSKKEAGTGLGLLIVRRIIREHGGEMKIESEEGEGTTVSFFFPRHDQRVKLLGKSDDLIELSTQPS